MALCAGGFAISAVAQQQQSQQLEKVEITGSNIKRIATETVAPLEIITREQIQRTGQPTIAEVLRNIPANSGGSFGESFSNSFAPGAAGISLRGLGEKTTLVLLNGRRVSGYGFAQNLQDSFVDLNAIPSSAVERVEILKDGASAIYGSDAIAGVVNIILRRDFKGLELTAGAGSAEGKGENAFTITGGAGDLGADKFNVFGVFDYFKRDFISLADTKFGRTRDARGTYAGGRNNQSLTGGGTWRQLSAANANTNNFQAIAGCRGAVITAAQAVELGLLAATSPQASVAANTYCAQDFNNEYTALPGTERIGFLGRATYEISPTTSAYAELGLSRNSTFQTFQDPFFAGTTGLTPTPAGLRPFTYNITFAPGVAGNPFPTNARYTGVLGDMGTRNTDISSDTVRAVGGLKYVVAGWDVDSAVGVSKNSVESLNQNRLSIAGAGAVFNVPSTAQPPIPISTTSTYNLDNPSLNSAAVRDQLRINFPRKSDSDLAFIDTKASTELNSLQLPGGPVGVAVGVEYRREKLSDRPDPIAQAGGVLGQGVTATDGSRSSVSVFSELALPITKRVESQLALRYDSYSDYGSSSTPKAGLKYTPNDMLALRASWGKGFRAPSLPEISPSVATFFQQVVDPETGLPTQISGIFAGNPNLKAEHSTSTNLGVVFEPIKNFSMSVDAYKIDWRDVVASKSFQNIIDASCPAGGPGCPSTAQVVRDPANANAVVTILSNYENLSQRKTTGLDVDARLGLPTESMGKFTTRLNAIYVHSFKEDDVEFVGTNGGTNTIPRIKASAALDWDDGPWSVTGRANYTHSFYQQGLGASFFVPGDPRFQTDVYPDRVGSYTTLDLFGRYQLSKNLTISGSIVNVLDKTPPYDPGFSTTFLYDFSQFDVRGRQYRMSMTYKM
jgi:iron complex outermembrane recepter protein